MLLHLEESLLGLYLPDRYFMDIRRQAGEKTPQPLVFVHEYWHYLQNLTTLHGIKSFVASQHLLAAFTTTMQPDGSSRGSGHLSSQFQSAIATFLRWRRESEGETGRDHDVHVAAKVVRIDDNTLVVAVRWPGTYERAEDKLRLGARAIKESIAHLVESEVAELLHVPPQLVPEFPYALLQRIFEHVVGDIGDPPLVLAALGTLALLTHAPGFAIVPLFQRYRALRAQGSALDALEIVTRELVLPALTAAAQELRDTALPGIQTMHRGRGMSEKAAEFLVGECRKGLELRLADPLFDLRPLLQPGSRQDPVEAIIQMMEERFVPCDMTFDGKILTFHPATEDEFGMDLPQYMRSFHAQQEFMMMHARGDAFVTSSEVSSPCPYFTTCTHPTRKQHESHCRLSPWRNFEVGAPGCWFTNGVSALLGPTKIQKL